MVNVRDIDFDFDQMEELFCQKQAQIKKPASPNTSDTAKSSPVKSVSLLDSKRSLTINIFLRQFKNGIPEVIGKVENAQNMNVDSLRGLLKILPDSDEVSSSHLKKKTSYSEFRFKEESLNKRHLALKTRDTCFSVRAIGKNLRKN